MTLVSAPPIGAAHFLSLGASAPKHQSPKLDAMQDARAHKVARDFEAVLLNQLTQTIFSSVGQDSLFGGPSQKMYQSMLAEEYSKELANSGGIGLANVIYKEIVKLQEAHQS